MLTEKQCERRDLIARLYLSGFSFRDIALAISCTNNTIIAALKAHSIRARRKHMSKPPIAEDKKLQAIKLYGEGLSTHDIAREISIAQESVRRVLIAAKVTLRSPMEAISLAMKRKHQCAKPSPIEQPAEMSAAN